MIVYQASKTQFLDHALRHLGIDAHLLLHHLHHRGEGLQTLRIHQIQFQPERVQSIVHHVNLIPEFGRRRVARLSDYPRV